MGKGGSLFEGHVVGETVGVDGRHHAVLGVPPVDIGAQSLLLRAVLIDALQTVLATATLDAVVHQHTVSRLEAEGIGSGLHHLARHVQAEDAGEPARRASGADAEVSEVDGAGANAYEDLAGFGFRIGAVAVNHDFGTASLVDVYRFHTDTSDMSW